jgi:PKD repeat protein
MTKPCNCCEGNQTLTPRDTSNRPGLDALDYRVGTHATFLETMKARLSGQIVEVQSLADPEQVETLYPLRDLTTRDPGDPSMAFLDAWATVGDVLTFYQERIANEGYLRTAIERRSLLELGRLVGYKPRPGVAASVYLAFTMEQGVDNGKIPKGTRVQSIPGPGELPQSFETSETIPARAAWNVLQPRMSRPQKITNTTDAESQQYIYFEGVDNNLQPGFPLLFVFDDDPNQTVVRWIEKVGLDAAANRTKVILQESVVSGAAAALPTELSPKIALASTAESDWVERMQAVIEKYLDLEQFEVSPGKMAGEVQEVLEDLRGKIGPDSPPEIVKEFLEVALSVLQEKYITAKERGYTQLEAWLEGMVQELESILSSLSRDATTVVGSTDMEDGPSIEASFHYGGHYGDGDDGNDGGENGHGNNNGNGDGDEENDGQSPASTSILDRLSSILEQLSKPPEEQVRSAPYLKREVSNLFGQEADTIFQLLRSLQPQLSPILYSALQNLIITEPIGVKIYAFRTEARPFGHNAPPRPDRFDPDRQLTLFDEWEIYDPLNHKPVLLADFLICPSSGIRPLEVQFVNRSEGQIDTYDWQITRDSDPRFLETSSERDFTFTFTASGTYRVKLTVSSISDTKSLTKTVQVNDPSTLSASFDFNFLTETQVQFSDTSVGDIVSWDWDFGHDNASSTAQNPTHTFPNTVTTYSVTLTISDEKGNRSTAVREITTGIIIIGGPFSGDEQPPLRTEIETEGFETHRPDIIYLDNEYEIQNNDWIVVKNTNIKEEVQVRDVRQQSLLAYGFSGKSSRLRLNKSWLSQDITSEPFSTIRRTLVYVENFTLDLAEAPVSDTDNSTFQTDQQTPIKDDRIEIDGVYDGLKPGRWLIITGEGADVIDNVGNTVPGVTRKELVMLAGIDQPPPEIPGDTPHTILILDNPLAYRYKRDTVKIYANVVEATHGETKEEVLGSGEASKAFQTFALGKAPLTYTAAPTAAGVESSLTVRVNEVRWPEADNLAGLGSEDRHYITRTDNEGQTSVIFGNGERGKRLPTGIENVKAVYRFGIGQPGNVAAEKIKLLAGRPLGVKGVINPLPASGGANREGPNQIRRNAPLAFKVLDRLVSAQDYADFAQTFAGIDRAHAVSRSDGQRETIYVTVAGLNDTPIDKTAQLYRNLVRALKQHGDPQQSFQVLVRDLVIVAISAEVKIDPDYLWEAVEPQIRAALLDSLSFENRALGQDVLLSEVISIVQKIPGVIYVDVNAFGGIPELKDSRGILDIDKIVEAIDKLIQTSQSNIYTTARIPVNLVSIGQPAQIAYLKPEIPQTLILNNLDRE